MTNNGMTTLEKLMFTLDAMSMVGPLKDAGFCGPLGHCVVASGTVENCNVEAILRRNPKDSYKSMHYSVTFVVSMTVGSDLDVACKGQRDLIKAAEFVNNLSKRIPNFEESEWIPVAEELERFFQSKKKEG
jgi:hypothetical protein